MNYSIEEHDHSTINVQKIFEIPEIKSIIDEVKKIKDKKTLWGVAPIAPLHFGYDSLILLQKGLIEVGCSHTLLLSDLHAMMSHGLSFDDVSIRCHYYSFYFSQICGLDANIIRGSYFQTRPGYIEDLYDIISLLPLNVIKDSFPTSHKDKPILAYMVIYPVMQCIDCYHIPTRVVIGEEGQKKIYRLLDSIEAVKKKRKKEIWSLSLAERMKDQRFFYYIPTSHDIMGRPLITSNASTRISIHESPDSLNNKIRKMYAPPGKQPINSGKVNALLEFYKYSIFPWRVSSIKIKTTKGSDKHYDNYIEFEKDYNEGLISPQDAKEVLYNELLSRINTIRNKFSKGLTHWINLSKAIGEVA